MFYLTHSLFESMFSNFHKCINFSVFLLLLISNVIPLWSEKIFCVIIFKKSLRLNRWQNIWSILKNFSYALERTCMLLLCWVFCIHLLSLVGLLCFLNPRFSYLLSVFSSHYWEYGVEITNYYDRNIYIYIYIPFNYIHF